MKKRPEERRKLPTEIKPPKRQVSLSSQGVIEHLKRFAEEHGLVGGTKAARDTVKLEMQGFVVDSLPLPAKNKAELKQLFAKRMRIVDARMVHRDMRRITAEDALTIFSDLRDQIQKHRKLFSQSFTEEGLQQVSSILDGEIGILQNAQKIRKKAGVGVVLKAQEAGTRATLLGAAERINGFLAMRCLGGTEQLARFNALITPVMQEYVNREFPEFPDDRMRGFIRKM